MTPLPLGNLLVTACVSRRLAALSSSSGPRAVAPADAEPCQELQEERANATGANEPLTSVPERDATCMAGLLLGETSNGVIHRPGAAVDHEEWDTADLRDNAKKGETRQLRHATHSSRVGGA